MFERVGQIRRGIKRAVERHRQTRGSLHESACVLDVYAAVGVEGARYDPRDSHASGKLDVLGHRINLPARIDEVTGPRPNQHEHRYACLLGDSCDQRTTRSGAANVQVGAKLDSVRTRALGGESALEALDRGFDESQTSTGLAASVSLSISRMEHS